MIIPRVCAAATLFIFSSCVEYRFDGLGEDRYIGTRITERYDLDTKLGSKTKWWLITQGDVRPYIGGDFRGRKDLTTTVGVIYYPTRHSGIEFGYRHPLISTDEFDDRPRDINSWEDEVEMFFIAGTIKW